MRPLQLFVLFILTTTPTFAGELRGIVTDAKDGQPLPGVNLLLTQTRLGAVTDTAGAYVITQIPEGTYQLETSLVGYTSTKLQNIDIPNQGTIHQNISLHADLLSLEEIIVTPGRFAVLKNNPITPQTLSREELQSMPQFGDDVYRAIGRLPGVTGSDFSSRFTIRGGDHDQVLVTLDGLELIEPFHMKDVEGGGLSIVDSEVIGGIDMITGGFPSDYGDKQSAVMEMKSATPTPGRKFSAGVGLANARLFGEGGNETLGWLVSARRGYVDLVLKLMNEDDNFRPLYYDLFGKIAFNPSNKNRFALNVLWASDNLTYLDNIDDDYEFFSTYKNAYAWLVWDTIVNTNLYARTLPYVGRITTDRAGNTYRTSNRLLNEQVDDIRETNLYGLKSDWTFQPNRNHLLRLGFDIKRQTADYDYYRRERRSTLESPFIRYYDTTRVVTKAVTTQYSAYLADKLRVIGPLTADIGLRFDRQLHTDENQLSPRVALALSIGNNTVLRSAWGRYYQSQSPEDLDIQYNAQKFRSAEKATHYILGLEHKLPNNMIFRIEGYYKDHDNVHDRFEDVQNEIELMPELHSDIARLFPETSSVRGLEFFLKRDTKKGFNWWASYTLSKSSETHKSQGDFPQVYGQTYPHKRDQRHQLALDIIYRPSPNWNISAAWQYRTGWPHTALHAIPSQNGGTAIQYIDLYDAKYPSYHRLDINLNRTFIFRSLRLRTSIGVINLYNRRNVRSYFYNARGPELTRDAETWFPRLPSFSLSTEF